MTNDLVERALGKDVIEVGQQFYIRASSSLADDRTRVLLNGDTFAVFDRSGDIQPVGFGQQGIFHKETRHLSRLEMHFCGERPLLLSSTIREDNVLFADGPDQSRPGDAVRATRCLAARCTSTAPSSSPSESAYDQITLHNYGDVTIEGDLSFEFEADFADIFEVRGQKRAAARRDPAGDRGTSRRSRSNTRGSITSGAARAWSACRRRAMRMRAESRFPFISSRRAKSPSR